MAVQVKDNNYKQSWGGINLFNSKDNGASVKSLYQNLQNLQKRTQKLQRPQVEVVPQHTEQNSSTRVKTFYTPIYRKNRLVNTGGTNKQEVNQGFNNAHKININKVRNAAELASSITSGSKVLAKNARDKAEANYRSTYKVSPNIQSDRSVDYNPEDPFLKDLETGQYLKDSNGNLINNSQWDAPLGYKLLKSVHDINTGTSMVLSMLPSATARGIGNAMFIGQNLADIHHDIKDKNYTSAGLNTAFTFAPYGINRIYKSLKPARRLSDIINKKYTYSSIGEARIASKEAYDQQLQNKMSNLEQIYPNALSEYRNITYTRTHNPRIDWEATAKSGKQWHADYAANLKQSKDPSVTINLNGQEVTIRPKVNYETGKVTSSTPELGQYLKDLETTLNGSALVGGSTRLYGSGIINGVPHDLELLTTKSRLGAVQKSIGKEGAQYGSSNGFKQSLEGNNKVFNSDGNHIIDVQTIGEDAKGYATGQLAHNYYSRLYPEKYKQLQKQWESLGNTAIQEGKIFNTTEQSLPIKAEELYTQLQKHPRIYDLMVAMDNYNGFKAKQVGRQAQMFSSPWLTNRIQKMNTSAVTNGWTRLKLTPQEIQEARTRWNIPQVYSNDAVESIVNQNLIADNMGIRTVFYKSGLTPKWDINTENSALRSVVAPFNGQGAGIGGNQLLNSSKGGLGGDVTAILNNRVGINSFQDYVNSIKNRLQRTDPNYYLFDDINRKVAQGTLSIEEGTKQTIELAKKLNINGYYGMAYGDGKYFGALQQPTIGLKNYSVGSQSGAANILEVGSNPIFPFREYSSMGFPRIKTINPYSAPMRQGKYVRYNNLGNPTKQTVEYVPQHNNYVYHATPKYDYRKAFYKYPQYRKWDSKLQESLKHQYITNFSIIPQKKVSNIQYIWDKYVVPIGITTGGIGSFLDLANNTNYQRYNPHTRSYYKRHFWKNMGN